MKPCDHCNGTGKHYARHLGRLHHVDGIDSPEMMTDTMLVWVPSSLKLPEIHDAVCQRCNGTGYSNYVDIRRNHTGRIVIITNKTMYAVRTIGL